MTSSQAPASGQKQKDIWNADTYGTKVAPFVAQMTEKIVAWLDPQPTDTILDIGCGEGPLTARLAPLCGSITGIDGSPALISHFNSTYPHISAHLVDCSTSLKPSSLLPASSFSKLFSNAALHWILRTPESRPMFFKGCYELLKPGGLLVSESGALGNVAEVHAGIVGELIRKGVDKEKARDASPWWFPSLEAMRKEVEGQGLEWVSGEIELRQTKLTEGNEGGVKGWIKLFGAPFKETLKSDEEWEEAVDNIVEALEAVGRRQHDGGFQVNYVRLRFIARRPE